MRGNRMQTRRNQNRGVRINEAVREEMALILRDLKDPRIDMMTSIVKTDITRDLKYCKIYVSVLGDEVKKEEVQAALKSASGYIRRELARRLNLRNTPELTFLMDDSIEYSIHIGERFKEIQQEDEARHRLQENPEEEA
jgi:ribosome-binding factor A